MATISYRTLSMDMKRTIVNKQLTEDQLRETSERMKEDNRKYMKRIYLVISIVAVVSVVMGLPLMIRIRDPKFIVMILGIIIDTLVIVYVICYGALIGIVKSQFNRAVKKAYPEIADEVKI